MATEKKIGVGIGALIILVLLALGLRKRAVGIKLKEGWNLVTYTGKSQASIDAFASIAAYLHPTENVSRWDAPSQTEKVTKSIPETTEWDEDTMIPYACYWVWVTQACEWTYGAEATAPTEVQLYAGRNEVPYYGEVMGADDALASIWDYFLGGHTWYTEGQYWKGIVHDTNFRHGICYVLSVTQDCLWVYGSL